MVVAPKAGEAPIDVWANQTQKSASWLGLDSALFGATTITNVVQVHGSDLEVGRSDIARHSFDTLVNQDRLLLL